MTATATIHDPWLAASSSLTRVVDELATRTDLIVRMVDSHRAPGSFRHDHAAISIDASKVLPPNTDPTALDFGDLRSLALFPVVAGVLAHEISHADHTVADHSTGPAASWARVLEEPRIETVMAATNPRTRVWMQASVAHLLMDADPGNASEAARVLVLLGGRLLGGVLDQSDDLDLDTVCGAWLSAEQIAVITDATNVAIGLADGDIAGLLKQGQRIADVLDNASAPDLGDGLAHAGQDAAAEGSAAAGDPSGGGDPSDGGDQSLASTDGSESNASGGTGADTGQTADNQPSPKGGAGEHTTGRDAGHPQESGGHPNGDTPTTNLADALAKVSADAATEMRAAAGLLAPTRRTVARRNAARARASQIAAAARRARQTRHPVRDRKPTARELAQAAHLIRRMRRAADRGIDTLTEQTATPPGRMDAGQLMQQQAQRAQGVRPTATPWAVTTRRRRPQPKLVVGIAADISPSMDDQVDQVGAATWLLNRAASDRRGNSVTVTWHSTVAVLPTKRGGTIPVASTGGRSEGLPQALLALDGLLTLTASRDARLVAIITDAQLPNPEAVNAEVARLVAAGVKVLWLVAADTTEWHYMAPPPGVTAARITDPDRLAAVIADAAVTALATS